MLVENCKKIKIDDFARRANLKIKKALIEADLEMYGYRFELTQSATGFNGQRFWFICPLCKKRAGIIYKHPLNREIGCRDCLNLKYRKRRYKGMIENLGNN
ncbi:MAG: hypothetical protein GF335_04835 [Candidatus Moranbacteria bacterium]|nr:hypothetical protein [Candidatus Moranbacteria bacterium]